MSETIEERYRDTKKLLFPYHDLFPEVVMEVMKLLDDLMAEREKMKEHIALLKKLLVQELEKSQEKSIVWNTIRKYRDLED